MQQNYISKRIKKKTKIEFPKVKCQMLKWNSIWINFFHKKKNITKHQSIDHAYLLQYSSRMDHQYNQENSYKLDYDLPPDNEHLNHMCQDMGLHIFVCHMHDSEDTQN